MRWDQGRPAVEGMIARREIERVPPSREQADALMNQARQHLQAARVIASMDPTGAYQLIYDGARKALNAVLENEGLRATSAGGHIAVREAVLAQLDPPLGKILRPFDRLRRRRNEAEYPTLDSPALTAADVGNDLPKVQEILDVVAKVLDQMSPF
jgi:hypothetical protein